MKLKFTNNLQTIKKIFFLKKKNKKIVMTNGCFDILHIGHVKLLEEAKRLGDTLVVAINSDRSVKSIKGQSRPINKLKFRTYLISSLRSVDFVLSFNSKTPINLISKIKPNVLVKGGDYKPKNIIGYNVVKKYGGTVKTVKIIKNISTTKILEYIKKKKL